MPIPKPQHQHSFETLQAEYEQNPTCHSAAVFDGSAHVIISQFLEGIQRPQLTSKHFLHLQNMKHITHKEYLHLDTETEGIWQPETPSACRNNTDQLLGRDLATAAGVQTLPAFAHNSKGFRFGVSWGVLGGEWGEREEVVEGGYDLPTPTSPSKGPGIAADVQTLLQEQNGV
jgi:hypothetical protein